MGGNYLRFWGWDLTHYDVTGPGPCSTLIGKSENTVPVVRTEECSSCSCAPPNRNNQHSSLLQQRNTTGWFLHLIMGCIVYYYYVVNTGRGSLLGFILTQFTSAEISVIQSELLQKPPPKPSQPWGDLISMIHSSINTTAPHKWAP